MGTQNKGARYQSISFDKQFIANIKDHIKDKGEYRSIADFVRHVVIEKIERDITIKEMRDKGLPSGEWELKQEIIKESPTIKKGPVPGTYYAKKGHTIEYESHHKDIEITDLKKQVKEIYKLLKDKNNKNNNTHDLL